MAQILHDSAKHIKWRRLSVALGLSVSRTFVKLRQIVPFCTLRHFKTTGHLNEKTVQYQGRACWPRYGHPHEVHRRGNMQVQKKIFVTRTINNFSICQEQYCLKRRWVICININWKQVSLLITVMCQLSMLNLKFSGLGWEAWIKMENRKLLDIKHDTTLQRWLRRNRGPLLNPNFFLISNISVIYWTS